MTLKTHDGVPSLSGTESVIREYETGEEQRHAQQLLGSLVQTDQYVGEVYSLGYETALVQIHDFHRREVGGIPSLCFLIATVPEDLLGQKSALFGMTRTGKSNTTKIIAEAVFNLRYNSNSPRKVGQIIFDPNGEYANANAQDSGGEAPNALKNVWRGRQEGNSEDVVTYGILDHPNDPEREFMLLNFHAEENLPIGKEIIDGVLPARDSKYIQNFQQVGLQPLEEGVGAGDQVRYNRLVLAYRTLLEKAGFVAPDTIQPRTTLPNNLFSQDLIQALEDNGDPEFTSAARAFRTEVPSWDQLAQAFQALHRFIGTNDYKTFENQYIQNSSSGEAWADGDLRAILEMIARPNGAQLIGQARPQHTESTTTDYVDDIYDALVAGKLVIVDQSSGDEAVNDASARRIVQRIFDGNKESFREGRSTEEIPDILIYAEEAHNLLPSDRDTDYRDIWVRTAKEGAKYNLGLIYVTQEVSSIQRNILKNTANWFIGHLNNTDETRELRKFYDFADFEGSILRAQDKGFLRVKTISNPFVVPIQVQEFKLELVKPEASKSQTEVPESQTQFGIDYAV